VSTPEGAVVRAVTDYLDIRQILYIRNNTGVARPERKDGSRGFVRFGSVGSADIVCCLPGGRFCAIECKAGRGKLTPAQVEFQRNVIRQGGLHIVAYRVEDVIEVFKRERI
jgi:hypothetical protein